MTLASDRTEIDFIVIFNPLNIYIDTNFVILRHCYQTLQVEYTFGHPNGGHFVCDVIEKNAHMGIFSKLHIFIPGMCLGQMALKFICLKLIQGTNVILLNYQSQIWTSKASFSQRGRHLFLDISNNCKTAANPIFYRMGPSNCTFRKCQCLLRNIAEF